MKRSTALIIVAVIVIAAVAAVGALAILRSDGNQQATQDHSKQTNGSENAESRSSGTTEDAVAADSVTIENFAYSPAAVTVKAGTTVTWTNNDTVQHNVVGDDLADLDGPLLDKGESYSYTFDTAGTYTYYCGPHPYMKGTVIVTE